MRLIEERRGSSVISYVYEPGSYVPLARLDASGDKTDQGGLGTQDDAVLPPLPHAGEGGGEGHPASKTIAARAIQTSAEGLNHSQPAANDAESLYWASLNQQAEQKAQALAIEGWGTGTDGPARQTAQTKIAEVYYFHTDQVGLPEELSNSQGQLVWQATYKTWGNTQAEEWKRVDLDGGRIHPLDEGDQPENEAKQQNLRFQGQYLDRDTGLHYNTFRYYDPDIGRFISPDPIGLEGGINLGSYSANPITWIDPWGWACKSAFSGRRGTAKAQHDLERNGFKVVGEEVTIRVNGSRIRADIVARDARGNLHVFEVKHGSGGLTTNQTNAGVYGMKTPSNTTQGVGGGTIRSSRGNSGKFTVATGNKSKTVDIGGKGTVHDATFHVLKY